VTVARGRRRRRRAGWVLPLAAAAVCFVLGIALGKALNDNPQPGGTQTLERTLTPVGLAPATVTVTTTR
jgi:hypothetical protein